MYPVADEKCLFVMKGVQGFNTNADNYFEAWEPIRVYLLEQRELCGWDIPTMKKIAGHSDLSRDHWTSKSQWNLPTQEVYEKFQAWAREHNIPAFLRPYTSVRGEFDGIYQEYEGIKEEFYKSRAYFDNLHDNMNNVWHFERPTPTEREEGDNHPTQKPVKLCARAIVTSSREGDYVLDMFGGSGSTLIACQQLARICFMVELTARQCDKIIYRWEKLTGDTAELYNRKGQK
jgi:hypothetical protein